MGTFTPSPQPAPEESDRQATEESNPMNIRTVARALALAFAMALSASGLTAASASAPAQSCTPLGIVNFYGVYGEGLEFNASGELPTFETSSCTIGRAGDLHIYRSKASTDGEVAVLHALAAQRARTYEPVLVCSIGESAGVLIGLAQSWGVPGIDTAGYAESSKWAKRARARAARDSACTLYDGGATTARNP